MNKSFHLKNLFLSFLLTFLSFFFLSFRLFSQNDISYKELKGIHEIVNYYDIFLIDIGGVVWEKQKPFPTAITCINKLQTTKKVILISNMAHPSRSAGTHFSDIGLNLNSNLQSFTSGDAVEMDLLKRFKDKKVYHFGSDRNKHICKGLPITVVDNLKDADLVLLTQFIEDNEAIEQFDPLLKEIALQKLPVICANPEKLMPYARGKRYCAGTFAERLEKMGVKVEYYGKSNRRMYELMQEKYELGENKKRILLVGDSIDTDIKGAHEYGVDSLLVLTGDAGKEITDFSLTEEYLKQSYTSKGFSPQWYMIQLQW